MIRCSVFLIGLACLLAVGCDDMGRERFSLPELKDLVRQEATKLGIQAALGSVLGSLLGFVVGLLGWAGYRLCARICCTGRADPWHSKLVGLPLLFFGTVLGGWLGMIEGARRQATEILVEGRIGKDLLPRLGNAAADTLVRADQLLIKPGASDAEVLAGFRAGTWKLDVVRLAQKINKLEKATAKQLATYVTQRVLDENPQWRGKLQETLIKVLLERAAEELTEKDLPELRGDFDPRPFLDALSTWAQKQGNRELTRTELSQFFIDQVLTPDALKDLNEQVGTVERYMLYALGGLVLIGLLLGLIVRPFRSSAAPE